MMFDAIRTRALPVCRVSLLGLALVGLMPASRVEAQGLSAKDEQAFRAYVLKEDVLERIIQYNQDAKALEKPGKEDEGGDVPASLDEAAAMAEKDPANKALLAKHGLTAREVWLASFALMRAAIAQEMSQEKPAELEKAGTNSANLAFVRQHPELVKRFQKDDDDE